MFQNSIPVIHQNQDQNKKFWNFVNNSDGTAELLIYGTIAQSQSWFDDEITPQIFAQELAALGDVKPIVLRINSGGGDPFAASAIKTALKTHPAEIIVQNDGLIASAATILMTGADKIRTPDYSQFMIHNPRVSTSRSMEVSDLQKMIRALESIKEGIINSYEARTGLSREEISKMMDDEMWMVGNVAVEKGFADELMFTEPAVQNAVMKDNMLFINSVAHDLSGFKTKPTLPAASNAASAVEISNKNNKEDQDMKIENASDLKTQLPAVHDEIHNAALSTGKADGVKAERERLKAFDVLNGKVDAEFLAKEKYEDGATAESVLFKAMKEGKLINDGYVAAAEVDAQHANEVPGSTNDQSKPDEVTGVLNFVSNVVNKTFGRKEGGK
jgi:ATP-dependent protease ClpP protease subunit